MEKKAKHTNKRAVPVMIALFAALISAGCFIQIPMPSGVPIVIQDMMALLSGLLLGPLYGALSVLLFLVLGCIGLPIFSGKAGIQVILAGPTGGFLIGYFVGAIVGGLILKLALHQKSQTQALEWVWISLACILATVIVFVFGALGFMHNMDVSLTKALVAVVLPYLPGNIIKLAVMIPLVKKMRPVVKNYLG